ncbi:MAG: hypothetical protein GVY36_10545 [Verrucomicrobia bacterium]|jgi:hypothetical protein|nr:hypothetical protein [Verrucomicrobiota bacterium]
MNALVFNHFFDHDITALERGKGIHQLHIIPFLYFRRRALRILGKRIINGELEDYNKPENEEPRRAWKKKTREIFDELHSVFRVDIFIVPSDTFCYIRDFINCCKEKNIPVLVLQKETTISPYTMEHHSKRVGREFPFIADRMLLCSSRQKEFWLNAGTEEHKIKISGQPRFDLYVDSSQVKSFQELGLNVSTDRPVILFFSYDLDAYAPSSNSTKQDEVWRPLREDTEEALLSLARDGYQILIKPHPQQRTKDEVQRLKKLMGEHWHRDVFWIDRIADARHLIANADCVVGFQTTGLYEAMLAGKQVVYTHWTSAVENSQEKLIPFWKHPTALSIAKSKQELIDLVKNSRDKPLEKVMELRREITVEHIGEFDGLSTSRAWEACEELTANRIIEEAPAIPPSKAWARFVLSKARSIFYRGLSRLSAPLFLSSRLLHSILSQSMKFKAPQTEEHIKQRLSSFADFWDDYAKSIYGK